MFVTFSRKTGRVATWICSCPELGITGYQMELLNLYDSLQDKCNALGPAYFLREFNGIHAILAQKASTPNYFLQAIHKVISSLVEEYQDTRLSLHIGIGRITDSFWNLRLSFESASHALKYHFFFPHQSIFDAREALGREFTLLSFTETKEEELIQLLCRKLDDSLQTYHYQLCELVISYIQKNFESNTLCLNDIAGHVNISPAYLSALFKKAYGQSISDTISSHRLESACRYLKNSTLPLKEISARCGYANQYYFSNSFKKKLGMSPSAYREKHSKLIPNKE